MLRESALNLEVATPIFHREIKTEKPLGYTRAAWFDEIPKDTYESRCRQVVKAFVTGTLKGKMVGYKTHVYSTRNNGKELWLFRNNPSIRCHIMMAKKIGDHFVGNASGIMATRQGKQKKLGFTGGGSKIQEIMGEVLPMVPFRMFKETGLDINSMLVVSKNPDEKIDIGQKIDGKNVLTHYTGAMVFKIKKARQESYFLFDIDRNDLKLKHMNAFLSKLARPCTSVQDAYASLKPQEVSEAERFLGHEVTRQGEWFFIPVQGDFAFTGQEAVLQSKGNRAHYVKHLSPEGYVKGKVWHGGGEHKDIKLDTWCKAVPNSAVESFKITGAID